MATTTSHRKRTKYPDSRSIRGHLDPPETSPTSRTGWRYVQCTDKNNELRVLIPPRTSLIYDSLLRTEKTELAKGDVDSMRELKYIRHLKDRMIRKCHRLCNWIPPADPASARPQEVVAPGDFRLKEMEQWWLYKQLPAEEMEDALRLNSRSHIHNKRREAPARASPAVKASPSADASQAKRSQRNSPQAPASGTRDARAPDSKTNQRTPTAQPASQVSSREAQSKSENVAPQEKANSGGRDVSSQSPSAPRKLQKRPPNIVLQDNSNRNAPPAASSSPIPPSVGDSRPSMPPKRPSSPRNASATSPAIPQRMSEEPASRSPFSPSSFNYTSYFEHKSTTPSRRLSSAGAALVAQTPPVQGNTSKLQAQYDSQYKASASPSSPRRTSPQTPSQIPQDMSPPSRTRRTSEDRDNFSYAQSYQQIQRHVSVTAAPSRQHTVNSSPPLQQLPTATTKAISGRNPSYDSPYDDNQYRKHRASTMPAAQSTDFYPSLDSTMYSPPIADKVHGRRATVDNGYSHERAQQTTQSASHRSHLGPIPIVDTGHDRGGRLSTPSQVVMTQSPQGSSGSSVRPPNAASPRAPMDSVPESRISPPMTHTVVLPQAHRGTPDISQQKTSKKSREPDVAPSHFNHTSNVSSRPSPPQQPTLQRGVSVDQGMGASYPIMAESLPSPPIVIYRGTSYHPPEHHMQSPPISSSFPDSRNPYAPISLSKPSPSSSRRSSMVAIGPESASDSFYSGLEFNANYDQSRPISRVSSVSDPVIPDASLLVEAAVLRGREKPFRPRLYEYASSSSPDEDSEDSEDDDGGPSRPQSRTSMRSGRSARSSRSAAEPGPSILKRSGSRCSQRSNKSVRLDIPTDQAAVQKVREMQDQVYDAGMKVDEARRRLDRGEDGAQAALIEAQANLKDLYSGLRAREESLRKIQAANRGEKQSREAQARELNRYVAQ